MEYMKGGDLLEYILMRNYKPYFDEASLEPTAQKPDFTTNNKFLLKSMIDLLSKMRDESIIHLDVKPENFIFTDTNRNDLKIIDTLLKTNIENFEQVLKIQAIIPAECLGFKLHSKHWKRQEAWIAVVDPKYITEPVCSHPDSRDLEKPEKIGMMSKIKEEQKTVDMVVQGSIDKAVEYFEESPLYPAWVLKSKLLFTWTDRRK